MKKVIVGLAALLLTSASLVSGAASAASAAIEQAKDQCLIGEQADGYLGVVTGADVSAALMREMREANQARKDIYADYARRNGVSIEVAGQIAANQQFDRAERGHCLRDQSGKWVEV